jgi:hypothetical protein
MKILKSFEVTSDNTDYELLIKKVNEVLINLHISADDIVLFEKEKLIDDLGFYYECVVTYKKEMTDYDSDPRMR